MCTVRITKWTVQRFSVESIGCTAFAFNLKNTAWNDHGSYRIPAVSERKVYSNGNHFQKVISIYCMGILNAVAKHQCPMFMA